jgi:beta-galactosidase
VKAKTAELACDIDMLRSLKKTDIKTPDGDCGFWAMEQKVGQVNWQDVNSLVRPGLIRLFTYQLVSRGASGILYFQLAAAAHRQRKILRRRPAAPSRRQHRVFRKSARSAKN